MDKMSTKGRYKFSTRCVITALCHTMKMFRAQHDNRAGYLASEMAPIIFNFIQLLMIVLRNVYLIMLLCCYYSGCN